MKTDSEIRAEGMAILVSALGVVDAERFIASLSRERFDYTRARGVKPRDPLREHPRRRIIIPCWVKPSPLPLSKFLGHTRARLRNIPQHHRKKERRIVRHQV